MSTIRTTAPTSWAISSQGETLASWSSRVTTSSSPSRSSRANARESEKLRLVMFCPKTTASASQPRKRPAAARASSTIRPTRWLVGNGPPRLAADSRIAVATASLTASGTWLPPGVSKKAVLPWSALNRERTASTSKPPIRRPGR